MKNRFRELTGKQKLVFCILCILLSADLVMLYRKYASPLSPVKLSYPQEMHAVSSRLHALNSNAKTRSPCQGYAYYTFSPLQQNRLRAYYQMNGDAAIVIRVRVRTGKKYQSSAAQGELPFMYGFLFRNDLDKEGIIRKDIVNRPLVSADLRRTTDFELSLALRKQEKGQQETIPSGFFIYSSVPASVTEAAVRSAALGWNISGSVPFYGFGPSGGTVDTDPVSADFTDASIVFPSRNDSLSVMPQIRISFRQLSDYGTSDDPVKLTFTAGNESYALYCVKNNSNLMIQTSALADPFSKTEIRDEAKAVSSLIMIRNDSRLAQSAEKNVTVPFKTDPGFILEWPRANWRTQEYELFEWDRFPGVLFFDTLNYDVQNDFFRRLAYFAEKTGYRGTLVKDDILKDKHGYNAHDYSAETLASFFSKASEESFPLNEKECLLRDILVANGVICRSGKIYTPGKGAVISISQDSLPWLRDRFIAHEGWHGIFFTDAGFRKEVASVYASMDPESREFLTRYWHTQSDLDYDMNDSYLVHNEFMAYLMQQPLAGVADYYMHLANRGSVMNGIPQLAAYVRDSKGIHFEDTARVLNEYAFEKWGLACGRVSLVR